MKKLILLLALALPVLADANLFTKYETVRQGLLKSSLPDTQKSAKDLAAAARKAKNEAVAKQADAVAASADLAKARDAFAPLSDEMIKLRASATGQKPSVYYCPMYKKSWLQAKGTVGNPYDAMMALCGQLKEE